MGLGKMPEPSVGFIAPRGAHPPTATSSTSVLTAEHPTNCQQGATTQTSFVKLMHIRRDTSHHHGHHFHHKPSRQGHLRKNQWMGDDRPFKGRPLLGPGWARRVSSQVAIKDHKRLAAGKGNNKSVRSAAINSSSSSLSLLEARKRVIKKYRKFTRHVEYQRLKSVVPSVSSRKYVSKVKILHEAIKYIDLLHTRLVSAIQTKGLPPILQQRKKDLGPWPPQSSAGGAAARCSPTNLSPETTISMIQKAIQPQLEKRLEMKRRMDRATIGALISSLSVAAASAATERRRSRDTTTMISNGLSEDETTAKESEEEDLD